MKRFAIVLLTVGVLALASSPVLAAPHGGGHGGYYGGYGGGHNYYTGYGHGGGHYYQPYVNYHYSPPHSGFGYYGHGFSFSLGH